MPFKLIPEPLTAETFSPFGDVIEISGRQGVAINDGFATRYHDLANIDVLEKNGRPLVNVFTGRPRPLPIEITMMERHPLSSQAFIPLHSNPFLVVVAPVGPLVDASNMKAFCTKGSQGVNYAKGVWHFPLLALEKEQDFLVIDRGGDHDNCETVQFSRSESAILEAWSSMIELQRS